MNLLVGIVSIEWMYAVSFGIWVLACFCHKLAVVKNHALKMGQNMYN